MLVRSDRDACDPDVQFWGWEALPALDRAILSLGGVALGASLGLTMTLAVWLSLIV